MFTKKTVKPKKVDLTQYNMRQIERIRNDQILIKQLEDPDSYESKRLVNAGRNRVLEEMEARLGISDDGSKPRFPNSNNNEVIAVTGSTARNAFSKMYNVVDTNSPTGYRTITR